MSTIEQPAIGSRPVIVAPLRDPAIAIDLRELLVRALERELAERCGGNVVLNRLEAEQRVDQLLRSGAHRASDANDRGRNA